MVEKALRKGWVSKASLRTRVKVGKPRIALARSSQPIPILPPLMTKTAPSHSLKALKMPVTTWWLAVANPTSLRA
jgi:hypothetical protein